MKDIKLSSGKEVKIKEMSVDDIDFCNDIPEMRYDGDQKLEQLGFVEV